MHSLTAHLIFLLDKQAPATGLGVLRILYGLITLQEIVFLLYFNHLIFDPIPYLDVEFPTIPFFLCLWAVGAAFVALGYRYQWAVVANYLFWIVFVNFTPMQRDFDGGFDLLMTGAGFFLLFLPADRALSLDNLRHKLNRPFVDDRSLPKPTVTVLAYYLPVAIGLGFLYFDSAIHKLFAEHWRNGLGAWLPSTQPYYVSALDMSLLLNQPWLQKLVGYTILLFQFSFLFLFGHRLLRPVYLLVGAGLHLGITLTLNIYPFGLGMLQFYALMVPFAWWRRIGAWITAERPTLTVFYDQLCPLCNRTALVIHHFDIRKRIDFKGVQDNARHYPAIAAIGEQTLLTDIYALDSTGNIYAGVGCYRQILLHMGYLAPLGALLGLPAVHALAERKYRAIADNRRRNTCTQEVCGPGPTPVNTTWHQRLFVDQAERAPKRFARQLAKILIAITLLQLNSSIHYGLLYRLHLDMRQHPLTAALADGSNALINLSQIVLGIAPHALYLHDHFAGYDRILAITYIDRDGNERWLPFVNEQGRLLAPHWGRVHSMWANIAVTPTVNHARLRKFLMKITAFWGHKLDLDLNHAVFQVKMKRISAPNEWAHDLLHRNFNASWQTIGQVTWRNQEVTYQLPQDINTL